MSRALLIIDPAPKSCLECPLCIRRCNSCINDITLAWCAINESLAIFESGPRNSFCPLKVNGVEEA